MEAAECKVKNGNILSSIWGRVKVLVLIVCFVSYAVFENDWSPGGTPAWVVLVGAMWMVGVTLVLRYTTWRERWTERELWVANPFRDFFRFQNKAIFFHFAAINSVAGGLGILTGASFDLKDGRTFHGLLFLTVGAATWLGLRTRDWVFIAKERRRGGGILE